MANRKKPKVYQVATAHLDTVWNWTLEQTIKEYLPSTCLENFRLFENYPHYAFNFEGAYRYALIKEYYPEYFSKLKEYVAAGRWHVTGSSWENGDVVTPEPETLMRNILYGNRFFDQEFGRISNDIFLPDCFGFPWTLPTLMKHMGLVAFSSQKLTWNNGYPPPFHVGRWEGIDGSEVIASIDPGPYGDSLKENPAENKDLHDMVEALPLERDMRYYGTGDIGGAPTDASARFVNEGVLTEDGMNEVVSAYAGQLADELTPDEAAKLPSVNEELLMVVHGVGSYTSVGPTKRFHRSNELKADAAERFSVLGSWIGAIDYPAEDIRRAWVDFIRHEFHDDLTGTSCQRAYRETFHDDIVVNNRLDGMISNALTAVAEQVDTAGAGGGCAVVFNPAGFDRTDTVSARICWPEGKIPERITACGADGDEQPVQVLSTDRRDGKLYADILFRAAVPGNGYAVYTFRAGTADAAGMTVSERVLDNGILRVSLDENGDVASIFDKKNGIELLKEPMRFQILKNGFRGYGAWEIGYDDICAEPKAVVSGPAEFEVLQQGPCRIAVRVTRCCGTSKYFMTVSLDAGDDYVRIGCRVFWNEKSSLLKMAFPLSLSSETAVYDAGLGYVEREDRAPEKYEVPVHKWASMFDRDKKYNVQILNDCKYGMDKCGSTLRLTCIHTPANQFLPQTRQDLQDQGENVFSVAVRGAAGDYNESRADQAGVRFNQPLMAVETNAHPGVLPASFSLLRVNDPGIAVKAIKKAEDTNEVIVRVCESFGRDHEDVVITAAQGILCAKETDGYERKIGPAELRNGELHFSIKKFAPKTFALTLKKPAQKASRKVYEQLPLPAGEKFTSCREEAGQYGLGPENTTVPRNLICAHRVCAGIPFGITEKDGELTFLRAAGQELKLPEGAKKVFLLAARDDEDGTCSLGFLPGTGTVTFGVQAYDDDIGGWDQYGSGHLGWIREDRVAMSFSHTHDKTGDRVYGRFAFYQYEVVVPAGAGKIVLPEVEHLMIAAISSTKQQGYARLATDIALHKKKYAEYTVRADGARGTGTYHEGGPVCLAYDGEADGRTVWTGADGSRYEGASIMFLMPAFDISFSVKNTPYARNLSRGCAVMAKNSQEGFEAQRVTDGRNDTCWKASAGGSGYLILDLGRRLRFSHVVIRHAECLCRDSIRNTDTYRIQCLQNGQWADIAGRRNNKLPVTTDTFAEQLARFLRILIDVPTGSSSDSVAMIVAVDVYSDRAEDCGEPDEPVSAYDITDTCSGEDILFQQKVSPGEKFSFASPVIVRHWSLQGADEAALTLKDSGGRTFKDAGRDVLGRGMVDRVIPEFSAIAGEIAFKGKEPSELIVTGNSMAVKTLFSYQADQYVGTRHPNPVRKEDGCVVLAAAGGGRSHDLYGNRVPFQAGYMTLCIKLRIPEKELAQASDDTPIFRFDPVFGKEYKDAKVFTVADYKKATRDTEGFRLLKETVYSEQEGQRGEMRIANERTLTLEVKSLAGYAGKHE